MIADKMILSYAYASEKRCYKSLASDWLWYNPRLSIGYGINGAFLIGYGISFAFSTCVGVCVCVCACCESSL